MRTASVGAFRDNAAQGLYFNLEDPADEIQRRFTAAVIHHGIDPEFLNRNLFVDSGRDQSLVVLRQEGRETKIVEPVVESLSTEMIERKIDVLIVDPFVSAHEIDENDNNTIIPMAAQAQTTCKQRADICAQRSQPQNVKNCYEAARMAQCKASGMYEAPSGKSWEAK